MQIFLIHDLQEEHRFFTLLFKGYRQQTISTFRIKVFDLKSQNIEVEGCRNMLVTRIKDE